MFQGQTLFWKLNWLIPFLGCVKYVEKNLSNDLAPHHILVISIDSGWVQTDMSGVHAPVSVTQSVEGMLPVISILTDKENGTFWTYKGRQLQR